MENFGKFMAFVLAMIISAIMKGFVLSKLWAWFIVATFQTQNLRIVDAIGVIVLINFIFAKRDKEVNKYKFWENFTADLIFSLLTAAFALSAGWIVTKFI